MLCAHPAKWASDKKRTTTSCLKVFRADRPLSQDELEAWPFLNQLFIWIGLDGPCDFAHSVYCPLYLEVCGIHKKQLVYRWFLSHFGCCTSLSNKHPVTKVHPGSLVGYWSTLRSILN